jgi:WD40 repeat protein
MCESDRVVLSGLFIYLNSFSNISTASQTPIRQSTMSASQSISQFVQPFPLENHVIHACFLGGIPVFATSDGRAAFITSHHVEWVKLHDDALLCATSSPDRLLSGGSDGKVIALNADRSVTVLAETKGIWIDAVALNREAVAWSAGKSVHVRGTKDQLFSCDVLSTARGLAFAPKGFQLAIAHYNGVTTWFPRTAGTPKAFVWKGSHLDVTFAPDGRFLVTSMQENALHGWRVADSANMRMSGYPSKTRFMSWSHDSQWLATSGAEAAIIWPFAAQDGPMGKAPQELGVRPARVSCVAFHPHAPVLAIGYADGCVMLVRREDNQELLVQAPQGNEAAVSAMRWNATGMQMIFGTADGRAGILTLPKVV